MKKQTGAQPLRDHHHDAGDHAQIAARNQVIGSRTLRQFFGEYGQHGDQQRSACDHQKADVQVNNLSLNDPGFRDAERCFEIVHPHYKSSFLHDPLIVIIDKCQLADGNL